MPHFQAPLLQNLKPLEEVPRRIVVATNRSADSLEYLGLLQVFAEAWYFLKKAGHRPAYSIEVVSRGTGTIYACEGLTINASRSFK